MINLPVLIDIVIHEDGRSQRVAQLSLPEPGDYGIGRLPENEIHLDAGQVSRQHAYLVIGENNLVVVDRDSKFGTYIGETRIERGGSAVWDGSIPIRIDPYEIQLVAPPAQAPAPPPPRREGVIAIDLKPRTQVRLSEESRRKAEHEKSFPWSVFRTDVVPLSSLRASAYPVAECDYLAIGGGLGSFVWVDHLRVFGVPAERIRVIGGFNWRPDDAQDYPRPYENYRRLCRNSQIPDHERLRSNSISTPDNVWGFPGYASRETWRELKKFRLDGLKYVFQVFGEPSVTETYTPRSGDVFRSLDREAWRIGWREMCIPSRVIALRKTDDGRYAVAFKVQEDHEQGRGREQLLVARFVHIATGYPAYRTEDDVFKFNTRYPDLRRAFKAYDPHDEVYAALERQRRAATIVVRGRGIVASRILQRLYEARARNPHLRIVHQMRTPVADGGGSRWGRAQRHAYNHTEIQPFNWPKGCWGGDLRREIEVASPQLRSSMIVALGGTSTADRGDWKRIIDQGKAEGWYQVAIGSLQITGPGGTPNDPKVAVRYEGPSAGIPREFLVDCVIDCIGLIGDIANSPFLKDLLETYNLPRHRDYTKEKPTYLGVAVTNDYEIAGLASSVGKVYAAGQITGHGPFAAVDSFLGLQYAALRSVDHMGALRAPGISSFGAVRSFRQWLRWCGNAPP